MKQPLGIVAVLFAGGLVLGNFLELPLPCLFAMSLAVAAGALLLPRFRPYLIWPLVVFTGWTNFAWHAAVVSPTDLRALLTNKPELITVRGTLTETPAARCYLDENSKESFSTTARINVTTIQRGADWQPASGQITAGISDRLPADFFAGREVQVYGVLGPPPIPIAEGLFDLRNFLRRQEIYFHLKTARTGDWQIAGSRNVSPPVSDRFTKWAEAALALGLPPNDESLHLEQALTLGDKTYLTDQITEPFVRAATYHIFAVDGLRLAILFGIFFLTFRALRMPRTVCGFVLIPLIWFYVALTGWPASAIRAAVMLTIVVGGWVLRRPGNVLNSLFAAALIILIWQPQQLFQAGFQLSFFVVLCILLVMPIFDGLVQRLLNRDPLLPDELRPRWQRMLHTSLRYFLGLFFSSLAAWVGSIPLVACYFNIFTPVSTPANVIAVPLCALVLASNLISLTLAGWFPAGAILLNHIGWHFMNWIRASSIWFASLPHAYAYVAAPNLFTICLYYSILLAVVTGWLFKASWRKWKFTALFFLLAVWCGQWLREQSATRLTILPLSGGNSVYCDAPGGGNDLLIDCGNEDGFEFVLKPYLRAQGVNSLPRLALTHGDQAHVAAFPNLQAEMPIEKVVTSSVPFRSPAYREIMEILEKTPGRRQVVSRGDAFANWTVLNPAATNHFPRADDNSLVLRGEFGGTRILLLSDLGIPGQHALLERDADLPADIVVAGLPQQNEPLNDALLDAIHPKLIIIADSEFPAARRASRALRLRLEKHGVPVLCTSEMGAVKISLRQNQWVAETVDGLSWPGASQHLGSPSKK
jgi:competence protein ComEC